MPPPRLMTQSSTATGSTTTLEQSGTVPFTQVHGTLVLRAEPAEQRRIQWSEDVVDNEGMGKKSSKVCCIYHRPHAVDESSGDDSSDNSSSSDSDSEVDDGRARRVGGNRHGKGKKAHKPQDHDHDHGDGHSHGHDQGSKRKAKLRKRSPNAYEKQPKYNKKPESGGERSS